MIILSLIAVIALSFWGVDAFVALSQWQSRIHIGRWNDREEWQSAIEKKAKKWLRRSPTITITDERRNVLWDMIRGRYRSKTIQSWQDAGLILSLDAADADNYLKSHADALSSPCLKPDYALLAYALKKKNLLDKEQEKGLLQFFQKYKDGKGTIPYRNALPNIRFVDTIGMLCPFLYSCGWSDTVRLQFEEYDKALYENVFPAHAYDLNRHSVMGVYDWSRGIGWYILGLIETVECFGNKDRIIHLAAALLPFQRKDGGFNCMVFNREERFESSGTALIGLLFVKVYQFTGNKKFISAAFDCEKALMNATRRDGAVDFAQGDTKGIGFYSRTFFIMPFAQGMTLLLSKELNEYVN